VGAGLERGEAEPNRWDFPHFSRMTDFAVTLFLLGGGNCGQIKRHPKRGVCSRLQAFFPPESEQNQSQIGPLSISHLLEVLYR
jgi:hypothetical protein